MLPSCILRHVPSDQQHRTDLRHLDRVLDHLWVRDLTKDLFALHLFGHLLFDHLHLCRLPVSLRTFDLFLPSQPQNLDEQVPCIHLFDLRRDQADDLRRWLLWVLHTLGHLLPVLHVQLDQDLHLDRTYGPHLDVL